MIWFYIADNQFSIFPKMDDLSVIEFQTNNGLVKLDFAADIDMYITVVYYNPAYYIYLISNRLLYLSMWF